MGALRLLLAFSVLHAHTGNVLGFQLVPADTAVHAFYIVSGFYMALVLNEKYLPNQASYHDFMTSRCLRIVPTYVVVVILTAIATLLMSAGNAASTIHPVTALNEARDAGLTGTALANVVAAQLLPLGLDVFYYLNWHPGDGFGFSTDFLHDKGSLYHWLLVPQAWSLSLELYFYALAPFIVRRPARAILLLIAFSLLCRIALWGIFDLRNDPWSYRFFPSELAFFLTGAVAYKAMKRQTSMRVLYAVALCIGTAEFLSALQPHSGSGVYLRLPFIALLVGGLPWLFERTKAWRLDRQLGELSYPLYAVHVLVIWCVHYWGAKTGSLAQGMLIIVLSLACAWTLERFVDRPVNRYRERRRASAAKAQAIEGFAAEAQGVRS